MSVEAMYQEIILDHYKAKHHSGLREPYQAQVTHVNPSCGDELLLRLALALHMAAQVPCPWLRWILVGDVRAKLNDPPGVERRAQR